MSRSCCALQTKKKSAPNRSRRPGKNIYELVAVVIVIIPIAIGVPSVAILIPPTMAFVPAAFARLAQFVACMVGLPTIPTVMFGSFVKPVVRFRDAALATVIAFGGGPGCSSECQHAKKRC
jgi:hypothetical protein